MTYPYRQAKEPGYGPRVDNDIQIDRSGPPSAVLISRLRRSIANSRMRRFRSVPVARRAWFVTLTAAVVDPDDFTAGQLVDGARFESQQFWLHARRVAMRWVKADRAIGGTGSMFPVEYRLCLVCGRLLLAAEAQTYRLKLRRPPAKWEYQEGPACGVECKPKPIIRNSKHRRKASEQQ